MRTGLGFDLWINDDTGMETEEDLSKHKIMKIKERTQIAYTKLIKKGMSTKGIADALHKTEDEVKTIFTFFEQLDRFEKDLESL
jgi:DNA-binding NarL/FixJ family response regulator